MGPVRGTQQALLTALWRTFSFTKRHDPWTVTVAYAPATCCSGSVLPLEFLANLMAFPILCGFAVHHARRFS